MTSTKPVLILEALTPDQQGRSNAAARAQNMLQPLKHRMQGLGLNPAFAYAEHFKGLNLRKVLGSYSGVVIPGGTDIDPEFYAGEREAGHRYFTESDEVQIYTVLEAIGQGMPVFGICRGFQLLNVALNGSLHVEISGLSSTAAHNHYGGGEWPPRHEVQVLASSSWIQEPERLSIVSLHHQGIDELGTGLIPVAVEQNPDLFKLIEGVEHENGNVVAVQWHPEHRADRNPWILDELLQVFQPPRKRALPEPKSSEDKYLHTPLWKADELAGLSLKSDVRPRKKSSISR